MSVKVLRKGETSKFWLHNWVQDDQPGEPNSRATTHTFGNNVQISFFSAAKGGGNTKYCIDYSWEDIGELVAAVTRVAPHKTISALNPGLIATELIKDPNLYLMLIRAMLNHNDLQAFKAINTATAEWIERTIKQRKEHTESKPAEQTK